MNRDDPPATLHFRIEPEHRQMLEAIARDERTTVSQLLRRIIAEWIAKTIS